MAMQPSERAFADTISHRADAAQCMDKVAPTLNKPQLDEAQKLEAAATRIGMHYVGQGEELMKTVRMAPSFNTAKGHSQVRQSSVNAEGIWTGQQDRVITDYKKLVDELYEKEPKACLRLQEVLAKFDKAVDVIGKLSGDSATKVMETMLSQTGAENREMLMQAIEKKPELHKALQDKVEEKSRMEARGHKM